MDNPEKEKKSQAKREKVEMKVLPVQERQLKWREL